MTTTANTPAKVGNGGEQRRFRRPIYEVEANADGYNIHVFMPGVAKDGVNIALNGRNLEIEGTRRERPQESWRPVLTELNWDDYRLRLELNVRVNESAISAQVTDGVLRLTLPKAEEAKPRRIEVA
jgi:HSP20 family molecular chaperone IbpA